MKVTVMVLALVILAGCERNPPPPVQPANEDKSSVELKLDTQKGEIEFKKEEGSGD